jgi:RNA polymerase sigma-70 factor (ECF subfamily)
VAVEEGRGGRILRVIQLGGHGEHGSEEWLNRSVCTRGARMGTVEGTAWEHEMKERLTARDPRALTEMYDQFGSYVFGLAARVIGDRRAAEDVTQDVFLQLWERPDAFDPERGRLRTFVGTLAHRRAIDLVRREEARRRRGARDAASVLPIPDVDELAIAIVTAEHVRAEVEQLPTEQRAAIELAYFSGRTYRQVAEELGIPEGTAKSRMRLGLRRIADALAAKGMEHTWT